MYKTYHVSLKNAITVRTGTDGYQPKFVVEDGNKFVKVQSTIQNRLMDDWKVEIIATKICEKLGIQCVKQKACNVNIDGFKQTFKGVVSPNFEISGYKFISYENLINRYGKDSNDSEYNKLSSIDKIKYSAELINNITKIPYQDYEKYLIEMSIVDILVLNQDRHTRNFGVFYNNLSDEYEIPLMFDFGMGLFENDLRYCETDSLDEALRTSYISPYGDDPFELLEHLDREYGIIEYVSDRAKDLNIPKSMFPNDLGYEYFKKVKKNFGLR